MVIDFSSYDAYHHRCHAYWYEKYINKKEPKWPKAQRDDALALGSLVHEGLRIWQQAHILQIPNEIVDEVCPTKECFDLATELVYGYTRRYPAENWPLILCEEPLTFDLGCDKLLGLAKIDAYFYVSEPTEVDTGIDGSTLLLSTGWWIHEYKTKNPFDPIGLYMQGWDMNMQASFQALALQNKINGPIQGVLVNVLEKPKRNIPKRKCLNCQEYYEFRQWMPNGKGEYNCPICGKTQKLTPLKENPASTPPNYYRFPVTRTEMELARDKQFIIQTGYEMLEMEQQGIYSKPWQTKNCVDQKWKQVCPYFSAHKNFGDTNGSQYQDVKDYRGLVQLT